MDNKHINEHKQRIASNIYGTLSEDESIDRTPLTDGVYAGTQTGEVVCFKKGDTEFQFKSPIIEGGDGPVVVLVQGKDIRVQTDSIVKSSSPDFYGANCHVKQLTQNIHLQKSFGSDLTHQMFLHDLEKGGKRAAVGETRVYGGEKWVKHTDGWVHVSERTGKTRLHGNDGKVVEGSADHTSHYKTHHERHERESKPYLEQKPEDMTHGDDSKLSSEEQEAHRRNQEGIRGLSEQGREDSEREIRQKHSDKHLTTVDQPGGVREYYHEQKKVATNDNGKVTYHDDETTSPVTVDENSHRVGEHVTVHHNLTTDPYNKKGKSGEIVSTKGDVHTIKFEDGSQSDYFDNTLLKKEVKEKEKSRQGDSTEFGKTKSGKIVYDHFDHEQHKDFSTRDHEKARDLHHKKVQQLDNKVTGKITGQGYLSTSRVVKDEKKRKEIESKIKYHEGQRDKHWGVAFANRDEKGDFRGHDK